jgi:hypothetical protein
MYSSSPEMVCIAEGLATEKHYADVRPCEYRRATLDALVASSRGYKVLSLMALDEADNIAHWHWPTDTIENVDVSLTERASEFALDITRSLDK